MHDKINNTKSSHAGKSLKRVFDLAHAGQIPHAIVMWNKHKSRHEGCICDNRMFDQTLCGFCLLSGLQVEGLAQSCATHANTFHTSAETVSDYLMRRSPAVRSLAAE